MDNTNNAAQSASEVKENIQYCQNCGAEMDAKAVVCPKCGVPVSGSSFDPANEPAPSAWWGVLGFCIPIAGWVLYFAFKKETPKRAHRCAVSAWWGFGIGAVLNIIAVLIGG